MITNINYKCRIAATALMQSTIQFSKHSPTQAIFELNNVPGKMIVFPSGKCRIMGLKKPLSVVQDELPYPVKDLEIQGISLAYDLQHTVNLLELANGLQHAARFEPELFPALRLLTFNPICVNVFASGKIIILGVKDFAFENLICEILHTIDSVLNPVMLSLPSSPSPIEF